MMLRKEFYFIVLVLALVIPATIAYAAVDSVILYEDSTPMHQVDLLDVEVNGPETHRTYTYAVTGLGGTNLALSHWVLAIDTCLGEDFLVSPEPGSTYNTPTEPEIAACETDDYNCLPASYKVTAGEDGSTGMTGLKFDILDEEGLKEGETHIFQITVKDILGDGDVNLLTKYGDTDTGGDETITGPVCPGPTAVTFSSSNVSSQATSALLPLVLLMGLGLATVSVIVWRRQVTTG